jgi:hypothetical protein
MQNLKWLIQPLSAFALGMLLILNLTLYLFWYVPGISNINSAIDQLGQSLTRNLAFEATAPLHGQNRAMISNLLNRMADQESVLRASVNSEEQGGIQLSSRTKNVLMQNTRAFQFPIHFSNELLGYAQIELSENQLEHWHSQAVTSWILFNVLSATGLGSFVFFRTQRHEKQWKGVVKQLEIQLPDVYSQLSGTPEQQLSQLMNLLNDPLSQHGQLLKHIRHDSQHEDTERLLEQMALVPDEGAYHDVALLTVQCQNWEELIRTYPANQLQELWSYYESLMVRVAELYSGTLLPDGFSLVFGLSEDEEYALNAVCAARVLIIAFNLIAERDHQLNPVFGISISAGPAFTSKTYKHGIPLPLITGDAEISLAQIKALQPIDQILIAEPVLQHKEVNENIVASLLRDITLRDGQRLEVWELEGLKHNDDLLHIQANTLVNTNK